MIINSDGLVLTNNHVIAGPTKVTATAVATSTTYPATVIGYDKTGDIALIKLEGATRLRTVPVGNSSAVKPGQPVVALGNAEGQGSVIPAAGKVTALNQTITASDQGGTAATETLRGMIETDAPIVPGDSGGPLAIATGQVIGMDTAGNSVSLTQQQTAGFAIPIDTALKVARQIAAGQASTTVTIGYPPFAPASSGTLVDGTICGSPAASAGITAGSVITAVGGQAAGSPAHLTTILGRYRPGDTISLTWVSPAGQTTTSSIHLAAGPPQ